MKNLLKSGLLILTIVFTMSACNSNKTDTGNDSTAIDTASADSIATDTSSTMSADTLQR